MQLHSSQRQNSAETSAVLLSVVKNQLSASAQELFRLQEVTSNTQYSTIDYSYSPTRRYTIDDNGGSYEGL